MIGGTHDRFDAKIHEISRAKDHLEDLKREIESYINDVEEKTENCKDRHSALEYLKNTRKDLEDVMGHLEDNKQFVIMKKGELQ